VFLYVKTMRLQTKNFLQISQSRCLSISISGFGLDFFCLTSVINNVILPKEFFDLVVSFVINVSFRPEGEIL